MNDFENYLEKKAENEPHEVGYLIKTGQTLEEVK